MPISSHPGTTPDHITLFFRQGSSDKVYTANIEPKNGGFVVNFAFGRRNSTMNTGTKTQSPVSYDEAKAIYDKLCKEKIQKGYVVGEDGIPYQHTDKANQVSGIQCQLLNPIDETEAAALVSDPAFASQEKFDGRRLLIRKTAAGIEGINRNGLIVSLPATLVEDAETLPGSYIIDGEAIGDEFMAFDVLLLNGEDIRPWAFRDRCLALMNLIAAAMTKHIHFVETAFDTVPKADMLERLKGENKEGVVFKRITAPYVAGRPASSGDQLKHKFYASASFIVAKVNGKRSVELKLLNGKRFVGAGNVTIPPNHKIPQVGAIVDCRFLYAFKESGSICQPVYLGERLDVLRADCTVAQLKFKPEPC